MSTCAVLPPISFGRTMTRTSFKGDQESHLNELIIASQKPEVAPSALQERTLIPYFDADPVAGGLNEPLQSKQFKKPGKGNAKLSKSSSTPQPANPKTPKQSRKSTKAATPVGEQQPAATTANADQGRKHHRDPSHRNLPELSSTTQINVSTSKPPRKRREHDQHGDGNPASLMGAALALALPVAAASKPSGSPSARFAGPAFTLSPTPDALPIPTTSLLTAEVAAEKMRSGLVL